MSRTGTISIALFFLVVPLHAQTLYLGDVLVSIAGGTTLTVDGEVENAGVIANRGHLKVAGPWVNVGTYVPEGEITFNSKSQTIPQIIHHNGQAFRTVNISGGTKKVILSDMVVEGEIRFHNGVVERAGNARLILDTDVVITGASDSSHVFGKVFHRGGGHKLFPLGDGARYLPVELTDIGDPSSMIGVEAMTLTNMTLPLHNKLEKMVPGGYWHIDVASGFVGGSPVVLPVSDLSWVHDPAKIVVAQSASPTEPFASIGRSRDVEAHSEGRVKSEFAVTKPFVTLATSATPEDIVVYNAVSANGDGQNDFMRIEHITHYLPNKLTVYNRWGDRVFEIRNYDNETNVFRGRANVNGDSELVSGTYFYVLEIPGREPVRGFVTVKN